MKLSLSARASFAFAIAMVLLMSSGWLSYRTTTKSLDNAKWVEHTHEVLSALEGLHAAIAEAESARRAFILTDDESMLAQYQEHSKLLGERLNHIQQLTMDNPRQQERIAALRPIVAAKLQQLDASIAAQRSFGFEAQLQKDATEEGAEIQQRIRVAINQMEREEHQLLEGRRVAAGRSARVAFLVIGVSSGMALLIVILASLRVRNDLRDRVRGERAVASANQLMQAVFDASTEASIIATDPSGLITIFNSGAEKMLGYSAAEIVGKETPQIFHPASETEARQQELSKLYGREIASREVYTEAARLGGQDILESIYVRKDGTQIPVRLAVTGLRNADQELSGYLGVAIDISAVRASEERVRLLLESTAEAIYGIDPQGTCTFVNPACVRMLGYRDANDFLGRNMHQMMHYARPDSSPYPEAECRIFTAVRENAAAHVDHEVFWRADGSSFPVEYWSYPMLKDGQLVGAVVTFLDITERRAVERMKNEFVSIVSHELRTPLTSIRGALGLLAGGLLRDQPEKGQRMLEIAVTNTDRLVRLINDILDIERMESGKAPLEKQTCDAAALIALAVETMLPMAAKAGVEIEAIPKAVELRADPDRVLQVLANLLSNAIKFSPPGGVVSISVSIGVSIGVDANQSQVVFAVRDRGRGIPAEKLEAIFERFQQVDASDAREKGGTGLGLPICRAIAQQHGGRIWAESTLGKGSSFFLALPVEASAAASIADSPVSVPERRAKTVLLCSAERSDNAAIRNVLEQRGYFVLAAASGNQAVEMAASARPDVILLDLAAPGMDAWQTQLVFKDRAETRDIPVLLLDLPSLEADEESLLQWLDQAPARPRDAARVLIVEDDLDLARVLVGIFERRGIEVFHAGTGRQAIELSAELAPDLLVLDLGLPEGDGFSVVDWLRCDSKLRRISLVVYTARDLTALERENLQLGRTEFITKSRVSVPEFEARIIGLLDALCRTPHSEEDRFHGS